MDLRPEPALSSYVGEDLKFTVGVTGFDLTGVACTFSIALEKNAPPKLSPAATLLSVLTDGDGVKTSLVQAFATRATVKAMLSTITGLTPGDDTSLFYEMRAASLPGDLGAAAVTTLAAGEIIFRGSVDV